MKWPGSRGQRGGAAGPSHPIPSLSMVRELTKRPCHGTKVEHAEMFLGMAAQAAKQSQRELQLSKEELCQGFSGKNKRIRKNQLFNLKPHKVRL